jgi:hypothetical protein
MDRSSFESSPLVFIVDAMILFLVLFVLTPIAFFASLCLRPFFGIGAAAKEPDPREMPQGTTNASVRRAA